MAILGPDVHLAVPVVPMPPGAPFTVRVDVPEVDHKARTAEVELGSVRRFEHEVDVTCTTDGCTRNAFGSPTSLQHSHREERWTSEWVGESAVPLFEGAPAPVHRLVELQLPADAPPTVDGMVEWQVRLRLDREKGLDGTASAVVLVGGDARRALPCAEEPVTTTGPTRMQVDVGSRRFHRGGEVLGTVTAWPHAPLDTPGLRSRLVRVRRQRATGTVERAVAVDVPMTGAFRFLPGQPFRAPFRVAFPPEPEPCCVVAGAEQHWYLEVVTDVPWGSDEVTRVGLAVS